MQSNTRVGNPSVCNEESSFKLSCIDIGIAISNIDTGSSISSVVRLLQRSNNVTICLQACNYAIAYAIAYDSQTSQTQREASAPTTVFFTNSRSSIPVQHGPVLKPKAWGILGPNQNSGLND